MSEARSSFPRDVVTATIVAFGVAVGGWFVGEGFLRGRATDRFVTVKGISERGVESDVALWPIGFVATDDSLAEARGKLKGSRDTILAFLERHGIDPSMTEVYKLEVNDLLANPYRDAPPKSRYIVTETLLVRTSDPKLVQVASQDVGRLVDEGVVLSSTDGPYGGPTYLFTKLTDLKPEMIAEATANARRAAEQFAKDSESRLGPIRRANQGVFEILPRDQAPGINEASQLRKTVRVVSTVDYYLED